MAGPKIHVWRPLSDGQPYLARIDGMSGITFADTTAMGVAKRARTWLEDEKARITPKRKRGASSREGGAT